MNEAEPTSKYMIQVSGPAPSPPPHGMVSPPGFAVLLSHGRGGPGTRGEKSKVKHGKARERIEKQCNIAIPLWDASAGLRNKIKRRDDTK